jgi:hypothetical protein
MEPSEQYWSACYNANLWQIRHNLQNAAMPHRLPILLIPPVLAIGLLITLKGVLPTGGSKAKAPALALQSLASADRQPSPLPAAGPRAAPASAVGRTSPPAASLPTPAPPLAGAPPAGKAETQPVTPAQALLKSAARAVQGRRSISARVRQRAELFGHQVLGLGRYLEVRQAIPLIRLELKLQSGENVSSLVEVCDGHYLWTYRKLLSSESLGYIDAMRATEALERAAGAAGRPGMGPAPGLGGLSRLLRGLDTAFEFTSAQQGRAGDLAVWKIDGGWRPEHLLRLLPNQKDRIQAGRPADLSFLPEQLPDHVVVLLGQEDLFPYRIDYCRDAPPKKGRAGTLATVEFFDVAFNVAIPREQFVYNPGTGERSDQTDEFIQSLKGR